MNSSTEAADTSPEPGTFVRFTGVAQVPLLTAEEMREWDRRAIEEHAIPERVLMEAAGRAVARLVHCLYPEGRIVAAVGGGNNGGDAVIALRTLRAWGREVAAVPVSSRDLPSELLHGWELPVRPADDAAAAFRDAAIVLDGILGTGASGAPREAAARIIKEINSAPAATVALDGPSGVDLTTGRAPGAAVRADVTITFGAPKRGLLLYPGRTHAGRIIAVETGFPPLANPGAQLVTPAWAHVRLPSIPPNAHKGTLGTITIVAGSPGMAGAAILVGMGAARAGAGMVRLVSPAANRGILQMGLPEALFTDRDAPDLTTILADADAVVAGPGMGTDDAARDALRHVLDCGDAPLLLDADALNLIAREPELLGVADRRPILLTPHPGEMARLMGAEVSDVTGDPFRLATEAAERFGCAVLLKGAPSLVAAPGAPSLANVTGHSGIATGGMGDTLAGIAGALLAQGRSPTDAGALALFFSGRAAEIAGRGRSLLPRDVADALPAALAEPAVPGTFGIPEVVMDLPGPY